MDAETFDNPMDDDTRMNPVDSGESSRNPLVWLLLGVIAIGCGILCAAAFVFFQPNMKSLNDQYFSTPTPTPTATPTPNMTATQKAIRSTATAQAIQTTVAKSNKQWNVLFLDNFESNKNQWDTGPSEDDYAKIVREVSNGKYNWDTTAIKGFIERIGANTKSVTDFALTVEGQRVSGSSSSDYGLVFRKDSAGNFYYFGVDNNTFHVSLNYNKEWIDVVGWTKSNVIRAGEPNRLMVIAEGSRFIFLINDQVVAEAIDDHISKGITGLAVQVFEADLKATFEFDNFELRVP